MENIAQEIPRPHLTGAHLCDKGKAGSGELEDAFGTPSLALAEELLDQVLRVCLPHNHPERESLTRAVMSLLEELQPSSALEGLLCAQMAACHFLAMEQLAKSAGALVLTTQQLHLQLGTKLTRTFVTQIETLLKLKGRSHQQKVVVEHVHVHQGGQAIVGQVNEGENRGGGAFN
jgi:hypothetical protein